MVLGVGEPEYIDTYLPSETINTRRENSVTHNIPGTQNLPPGTQNLPPGTQNLPPGTQNQAGGLHYFVVI